MHFPPDDTSMTELSLRRAPAQRALAFEEIFLVQLALAERRQQVERAARGAHYELPDALRVKLAKLLPFKLTDAQKRALVLADNKVRAGPGNLHRTISGVSV